MRLLEDGLEMSLNGVFADPERVRDLFVAQSIREKRRNLTLAQGQTKLVPRPRRSIAGAELRAHERSTGCDLEQRVGKRARPGGFGDDAASAGVEGLIALRRCHCPRIDRDVAHVRIAHQRYDALETKPRAGVRVEQRNVDATLRILVGVPLNDAQQIMKRSQYFRDPAQYQLIVVDEFDRDSLRRLRRPAFAGHCDLLCDDSPRITCARTGIIERTVAPAPIAPRCFRASPGMRRPY